MVPGGVSVWTREQIVRLPPEEYRAMSALIDEAEAVRFRSSLRQSVSAVAAVAGPPSTRRSSHGG